MHRYLTPLFLAALLISCSNESIDGMVRGILPDEVTARGDAIVGAYLERDTAFLYAAASEELKEVATEQDFKDLLRYRGDGVVETIFLISGNAAFSKSLIGDAEERKPRATADLDYVVTLSDRELSVAMAFVKEGGVYDLTTFRVNSSVDPDQTPASQTEDTGAN